MNERPRMSPFTALFLMIGGVSITGICAGTVILLYAVNAGLTRVDRVSGLVEHTLDNLPEIIDALPLEMVGPLAPQYADELSVDAQLTPYGWKGSLAPSVTITNNGAEVVTLLTVNVAAIDGQGRVVEEWSEIVATPIGLGDDLRGPILPNGTRRVVLDGHHWHNTVHGGDLTPVCEISELRTLTVDEAAPQPGADS